MQDLIQGHVVKQVRDSCQEKFLHGTVAAYLQQKSCVQLHVHWPAQAPNRSISNVTDILLAKVTPKLIGIENPWNCLCNLETICIPSVWHTSRTTLHDYSREQDVVWMASLIDDSGLSTLTSLERSCSYAVDTAYFRQKGSAPTTTH